MNAHDDWWLAKNATGGVAVKKGEASTRFGFFACADNVATVVVMKAWCSPVKF